MKDLLTILFLIISVATWAQKPAAKSPEEFATARTAFLKHLLGLDDVQEATVNTLTMEKYQAIQEIKGQKLKDKAVLAKNFKIVRSEYNKEMKEILTKEQMKKWKDWKNDKKLKSQGQKPKNKPDKSAPPDETIAELDID